jgi:hypothetical protein
MGHVFACALAHHRLHRPCDPCDLFSRTLRREARGKQDLRRDDSGATAFARLAKKWAASEPADHKESKVHLRPTIVFATVCALAPTLGCVAETVDQPEATTSTQESIVLFEDRYSETGSLIVFAENGDLGVVVQGRIGQDDVSERLRLQRETLFREVASRV